LDVVGILSTSQLSGGHYGGSVTSSASVTNNLNTTGIITTTGLLSGDGSALTGIAFTAVAILQDIKAANTGGGSVASINTWYDRELNTIVSDEHNIVSLSSSNFTLGPGLYKIKSIVPGTNIGHNKARIYNNTDNAVLFNVGYTSWAYDYWRAASHAIVSTNLFEITSNKSYKIQQMCTDTGRTGTYDLGYYMNINLPEHYTLVYILKGNV